MITFKSIQSLTNQEYFLQQKAHIFVGILTMLLSIQSFMLAVVAMVFIQDSSFLTNSLLLITLAAILAYSAYILFATGLKFERENPNSRIFWGRFCKCPNLNSQSDGCYPFDLISFFSDDWIQNMFCWKISVLKLRVNIKVDK